VATTHAEHQEGQPQRVPNIFKGSVYFR